jgi:uncharacterized protein
MTASRSAIGLVLMLMLAGCNRSEPGKPSSVAKTGPERPTATQTETLASPIVDSARRQIGRTTIYDPAYVKLDYPDGDVPMERGVCADVVIRALRDALGMDLQRLLHEDMKRAFSRYPRDWGLTRPDPSIDHRRVLNLRTYFARNGYSLGVSQRAEDYLPGDLVTCTVAGTLPHIMIVSDRTTSQGVPLVIHNIAAGAREENRLFEFPITGHYRVLTPRKPNAGQASAARISGR